MTKEEYKVICHFIDEIASLKKELNYTKNKLNTLTDKNIVLEEDCSNMKRLLSEAYNELDKKTSRQKIRHLQMSYHRRNV